MVQIPRAEARDTRTQLWRKLLQPYWLAPRPCNLSRPTLYPI